MNLTLNINQMLFSNMHVGYAVEYFNSQLKGILIGSRNKVFILDLKISILQLRVISNFILNLVSKRNVILLVKEGNYLKFADYISAQLDDSLTNLVIYETKGYGGILTNYKTVFFGSKLKNNNLRYLEQFKRFPSVMCFFNSNLSYGALLEGYNLRIPTISLIDSDSLHSNLINYQVIGSNKNINSSLLYLSVICNGVKYGRRKEIAHILRLSVYEYKNLNIKFKSYRSNLFGQYKYLSKSYRMGLFRKFIVQGGNGGELL